MFDIRVKSVKALDNFLLEVEFNTGVVKQFDVSEMISKYEDFEPLKNKNFFQNVSVDLKGYGIFWNDDIDISASKLWKDGVLVKKASKTLEKSLYKNGQGRYGAKINLPLNWLQTVGVTEKDEVLLMNFDGDKIEITKA